MIQERLEILAEDIKNAYQALEEKGATIPADKNTNNIKETVESIELEGDVAPVGMMSPFCGTKAPAGYLFCVGTAVSRETYKDLFAVIGIKFGDGDGSTTFNLPDMRSRFAEGASTTTGHTLGSKVDAGLPKPTVTTTSSGSHSHTFTGTQGTTSSNGSHYHSWSQKTTNKSGTDTQTVLSSSENRGSATVTTNSTGAHTHTITPSGTISSNGSHTHTVTIATDTIYGNATTVQPASVCVQWIIKY